MTHANCELLRKLFKKQNCWAKQEDYYTKKKLYKLLCGAVTCKRASHSQTKEIVKGNGGKVKNAHN